MTRKTFLTVASIIGVAVGLFASLAPAALLESKGIVAAGGLDVAQVWVREVGVLILAVSVTSFAVRDHAPSPTLRALLLGNALLQTLLFPIEIVAFVHGTIPIAAGIVPNSVLHVLLAAGFVHHARAMRLASSEVVERAVS